MLLSGIGIAYAYISAIDQSKKSAVAVVGGKTACIDVDIESLSSSGINILSYNYPITDTYALQKIKPIEVSVTNKCKETQENIKYTLTFTTLTNNDNQIKDFQIKTKVLKKINNGSETLVKDTSLLNKINRVKTENVVELLNNKISENELTKGYDTKNSYVLDVGDVASNTTNVYNVYLWIDYYEGNPYHNVELANFNNSTQNKEFKGIFGILTNIEENGEKLEEEVKEYEYTGGYETFTPTKDGEYLIELWGASGHIGGDDCIPDSNGRGAYTIGVINLQKNEPIYIYVGGNNRILSDYNFNGGGGGEASGGGATDIRLTSGKWSDFNSLKSRIMVAAGGGGYAHSTRTIEIVPENQRGDGGAINGIDAHFSYTGGYLNPGIFDYSGHGATQTSGGLPGSKLSNIFDVEYLPQMSGKFGSGGYGTLEVERNMYMSSGGGGGYYGGGHGIHPGNGITGGGGGSSFVSGYPGCDAIEATSTEDHIIHTGKPEHYSGKVFFLPGMIAGNAPMPTYKGDGTMIGNNSAGYAKITYLG